MRFILISFFLLVSCSTPCRQWHLEEFSAVCPSYPISRLYLPASVPYNGIELEITRGSDGIRMYANVFSLPLPASEVNPFQTEVKIKIGDDTYEFCADRLEGDQRLLFSQDAVSIILSALAEGKIVQISAGPYKDEITPENFFEHYQCLFHST